ncbi:undecaprenyl-diphosphate phosphatase [Acidipropionibacterium jensenii]|uniref:Undecaprenyl-diphosphatase n=3 Tax=Acidipropionibacterium jensenii TaxID=1749 RepID=A0A3Q9UIN5_9ACTN|nr:undecaprenyl-diphosphate phosphatase [Acidipropionibacterium jensenii]AZZ43018.1 undecaprenyl-diphosphate phosphatase [Acidipropionibacterium jensenii]MDN5977513.1 undecaprenyl-diphosphate phosphatase [Acidipropionibacterium jensenii]MDN5996478.1 undecaprenyl-diphosphate phosphatase [Acidipropionibacterium jensenii]MDN6020889.1 undecaprenyl-diphosphate phosphatase [Acidipropionibacterium jensenii]MDN6427656.1 undecaprenyl-diphosphate phosphatase [Acidipropionibacterium jensenii]
MNWWQAVILGIVEGITEFLPVSSTGHLRIVEHLLGFKTQGVGITAFTAIIQVGAIAAAIIYFWKDIVRIVAAWFRGLFNKEGRDDPDYTLGWGIIIGSIPVAVVGLVFKDAIQGPLSSIWVVAGALIIWSFVMMAADRRTDLGRGMKDVTLVDATIIGCFQALSPLFPGISRSGATISAGLFRKFDRTTATRLSFFMGIPALVAAGIFEAITEASHITASTDILIDGGMGVIGWGPTIIATLVSLVVAYFSIAWLLKFVSSNKFTGFIWYRIVLGVVLLVLAFTGLMAV